MGLITNLLRANQDKKLKDTESQLQGYKTLLALPEEMAPPETKQWALDNIIALTTGKGGGSKGASGGGKDAGGHDILRSILGTMAGLNPMPGAPKPVGQEPANLLYSGAEQEQKRGEIAQREQTQKAGLAGAETTAREQAKAKVETATEEGQYKKQQDRIKQLTEQGIPRDEAEFEVMGKARPREPLSPSMKSQWVNVPGETEPRLAFVNPRNPNGFVDENNSPLPEGTKATPTPTNQRMYGAIQAFYFEGKSRGMSDEQAKEYAGKQAVKQLGTQMSSVQQRIAVTEALSGIPGGPGFGGGTTTPSPTGSGASSSERPAPSARPQGKPQARITPADQQNIQVALADVLGTSKASGPAKVRVQNGMKKLAELTGLDPLTLQGQLVVNKDFAKAIGDTVQRYAATDRLSKIMELMGDNVIENAQKVVQTGSPLLNRPIRTVQAETVGSPALRQFLISLNGLQRQYATVTSGGGLSKAQLPVTVQQNVEHMLNPNATLAEVIASVQQIKREAEIEKQGFGRAVQDALGEMKQSPIGQAVQGGSQTQQFSHTAVDAKGNRVGWDGSKWVPIPK